MATTLTSTTRVSICVHQGCPLKSQMESLVGFFLVIYVNVVASIIYIQISENTTMPQLAGYY